MRKIIILFLILIIAALSYFAYANYSNKDLPTFGLPPIGDKGKIKALTKEFFESVKFKNYEALKHYVSKSLTQDEIYKFLDKTFETSHSEIDLQNFQIGNVEIDSQKTRARIKVSLFGIDQKNSAPLDKNKTIYLYYDNETSQWLIDITHLSN